jgi:hypothetical protein
MASKGMRLTSAATRIVSFLFCLSIGFNIVRSAPSEITQQFGTYVLQHHYVAVELGHDGATTNSQTVAVRINGHKLILLVDSGTSGSCLTSECAHDLKLDVHDAGFTDWGAGGEIKGNFGVALVKSFTIGGWEINRTNTIQVLPRGVHFSGSDGIMGLDLMSFNKAIYPVGGTGFLLKPGPDRRFRSRPLWTSSGSSRLRSASTMDTST